MFKNKLYNILEKTNSLHRTPEEVFEECINQKLDNTLTVYYDELMATVNYLLSKNTITVLKGFAKTFQEEEQDD